MILDIPDAAIEWLQHGEHGASAATIFRRLTGLPLGRLFNGMSAPWDPADLRRCRLLLDAVPEFQARLGEMADVGGGWSEIVPIWGDLCRTMDDELIEHAKDQVAVEWLGNGGLAPFSRTHRMIREALDRYRTRARARGVAP